jgi:hypothetical protein
MRNERDYCGKCRFALLSRRKGIFAAVAAS